MNVIQDVETVLKFSPATTDRAYIEVHREYYHSSKRLAALVRELEDPTPVDAAWATERGLDFEEVDGMFNVQIPGAWFGVTNPTRGAVRMFQHIIDTFKLDPT